MKCQVLPEPINLRFLETQGMSLKPEIDDRAAIIPCQIQTPIVALSSDSVGITSLPPSRHVLFTDETISLLNRKLIFAPCDVFPATPSTQNKTSIQGPATRPPTDGIRSLFSVPQTSGCIAVTGGQRHPQEAVKISGKRYSTILSQMHYHRQL